MVVEEVAAAAVVSLAWTQKGGKLGHCIGGHLGLFMAVMMRGQICKATTSLPTMH
jgi:hypothetical protein